MMEWGLLRLIVESRSVAQAALYNAGHASDRARALIWHDHGTHRPFVSGRLRPATSGCCDAGRRTATAVSSFVSWNYRTEAAPQSGLWVERCAMAAAPDCRCQCHRDHARVQN